MGADTAQQSPAPALRAYRSPLRAQKARRTRQRVLAAAGGRFLDRGYAATSIRAVAGAAGVSVPTVEALFGTKARLLKECIDVAIAGDDAPVAVLNRQWAVDAMASPEVRGFLRIVTDVLCSAQERSAGLVLAAYEAAPGDQEIAALVEQLEAQRAVTAGWILDRVSERAPLRAGLDRTHALDQVWLLMDPAFFRRLTRSRGWTTTEYGRWFADTLPRLLLTSPP